MLSIRQLQRAVQRSAGPELVRSFCVLDDVEINDYSGHATLGHCDIQNISQNKLGIVRKKMRMDLANIFSNIIDIDRVGFATTFDLIYAHFVMMLSSNRSRGSPA